MLPCTDPTKLGPIHSSLSHPTPSNLNAHTNPSHKSLKTKNLEYMVDIRRNNRKDAIRNARFRNVLKATDQDPSRTHTAPNPGLAQTPSPPNNDAQDPDSLCHLAKVKDAQRILKLITDAKQLTPDASRIAEFLDVLRTGQRLPKHQAIIMLRRLLTSQQRLPIQAMIDLNAVPVLIRLARDSSELHLRLEATWCLANLVSGTTQQTWALVKQNVIQVFEAILDDPYPKIVEQAVWGLGNIIGDSVKLRQAVVQRRVLRKLISILNQPHRRSVHKDVVWCLSNALRQKPRKERHTAMKRPVAALIRAFVTHQDADIKRDCLLGVSGHCKSKLLGLYVDERFLDGLREYYRNLCESPDFASVRPQIKAVHKIIGNITNSNEFDTTQVIRMGYLRDFCAMLRVHPDKCGRDICWILSNIAAGSAAQIAHLLAEPGLFDVLVGLLHASGADVQRETLWVLCNMTKSCSSQQQDYLIERGLLGVFKQFLGPERPQKMVLLILEAIPNVIRRSLVCADSSPKLSPLVEEMYECGLADIICGLQRHKSEKVYRKCVEILESFFELEEY